MQRAGWLMKRGVVVKGWRRRYVALYGNLLFYYEYKDPSAALGMVRLLHTATTVIAIH
jgi:hypothetical protein